MDIIKKNTVCFTGHRPEKLPDGGNDDSPRTKAIKSMLYKAVLRAAETGHDTFITGMQRGVDLWAGEIVLELKEKYGLRLIAVYPHRRHGAGFRGKDKWLLGRITDAADEVIYISEDYTRSCLHERNKFMVDNSSHIIAVIGDYRSGTGKTLSYARSCGLTADITDTSVFSDEENDQLVF